MVALIRSVIFCRKFLIIFFIFPFFIIESLYTQVSLAGPHFGGFVYQNFENCSGKIYYLN